MDCQLDQVIIHQILLSLRSTVLRRLTALFKKNVISNWFTIHLCTFILLNNYELATSHDRSFAIRHNLSAYYSNYPLLEGFHAGAKTLLAYFHFICKGSQPFALNWSLEEDVGFARFDQEQVEFMQFISDEVRKSGETFKQLKNSKQYEKNLYLVSQMYEPEWTTSNTL
ncbi:uncharacterized protein LY89DRAFT_787659 [Mollisia scopiformis]|uniref:Uncharacterized protein n=1 Tax=Mollisia scopiformis TaxID=149040 RepID=A0A132BC60_MOLSC|nr:uncharacterized protein LY89DRAFT_787659 [Mollisia scopiformis]KUJ09976.1 hypothetical protein LY89DRAFT_787659 [Mollisia scopiformis]